jgi:hypothetical protein
MEVFLVNHKVQNCGVYQFGKRVSNILSISTENKYRYFELDNNESLLAEIYKFNPAIIIYNHLEGTMPWVNESTVGDIRNKGIKQGLLVHNINYANYFDFFFHQDPYFSKIDQKNFALPRPLFDYSPKKREDNLDTIMIGSFGFGFKVKHFDEICRRVVKDFKRDKVQVNLHITESFFSPNKHVIDEIENKCLKILKRDNHQLKVTRDFKSDEGILDFLANQDLNIFLYEKYKQYNGISSTIDYALSAQRPLAINKSIMFSHLSDIKPSIYIEDHRLRDIMEKGITQLDEKRELWSNQNFRSMVDLALESIK